ncbi:MAG: OPT/YSL family transporter, partial [Candidatus Thermoplasmatota archaeon]|nr:OPT/YSL family transporter [Candidatus Thermoplasmatota archaeon]
KPYNLIKGELTGLVPGAFIAVTAATIFSIGLAKGELQLVAPQARAFAGFSLALMGGAAPWNLIILGFFAGIFIEIITGMGTSFGLGLYFPLPVSLTILLGGTMRNLWEAKWLKPKAEAEGWDDRTKTMKLIDSYIICIGLVVGEALLGTIVAIYVMCF